MHRIDPRIVIIQIVLSGICAFWIFKPLAMLCEVISVIFATPEGGFAAGSMVCVPCRIVCLTE